MLFTSCRTSPLGIKHSTIQAHETMSPQAGGAETTASKPPPASTGAAALEFEPPLACVRRILKNALPSSTNVGKDASSAFARASGIFVIYLTACANDFARENRRQTITANDVLAAVKELDFDEFTPQLTAFLEKHRATEKSKKVAKAKAKEDAKSIGGEDDEHDVDEDGTPPRAAKKPRLEEEVENETMKTPMAEEEMEEATDKNNNNEEQEETNSNADGDMEQDGDEGDEGDEKAKEEADDKEGADDGDDEDAEEVEADVTEAAEED
mmetsp:Transcript_3075/g.4494  ORF Transcript_3075/g.4494 Transcript_3075/m.4494 type:complete len:268 (-) Transcript_3075:117-920(-)